MVEQTLEIRGIPLSQICTYLNELGGLQQTVTFPILFTNEDWSGEILYEVEVQITSRFSVNAIHIHFTSADEPILEEIIRNFRKKTMRIGG